MKNETNSLYKLEALTNSLHMQLDNKLVNSETEFKIEFSFPSKRKNRKENKCKRSKSVNDFNTALNESVNEDYQNKENENPQEYMIPSVQRQRNGLILDSGCLAGLPSTVDKRRGVKMGVRAFSNSGLRMSRSVEAVNSFLNEDLEQLSLQSISLHCSTNSVPRSVDSEKRNFVSDAYVLGMYIYKVCNKNMLINYQYFIIT